jgi:DNA invertase Pin-like site-specific DNA recombinase
LKTQSRLIASRFPLIERAFSLIRERTAAGLAAARARGRKGGRKPALTTEKQTAVDLHIRSLPAGVDPDPKAIGRAVGVSDRTIRRYLSGQYAGFVQNA